MELKGIFLNLLSNLIWAGLGALVLRAVFLYRNVHPARILWRLKQHNSLVIVVSNSSSTHTGEYVRRATGVGILRALAPIITSLNQAYGRFSVRNIFLSSDELQDRLVNDLLVIGGPKTNRVSFDFLDLIADLQPLKYKNAHFYWRKMKDGVWVDDEAREFRGEVEGDNVVKDYGFIVRAPNPFANGERELVFFAGSHTPGTIAAARFFTEMIRREIPSRSLKCDNFSLVVSATIRNDYPVNIHLVRSYFWEDDRKGSGRHILAGAVRNHED